MKEKTSAQIVLLGTGLAPNTGKEPGEGLVEGDILVGSIRVQHRLNTLVGAEGPIQVEPRVIQVLISLARRAGQVVPKDELIREVWGETFVSDDVLTNSIWELRRALGDNARQPRFIQTVSKRGYRLIAPVRAASNGAPGRSSRRTPVWIPLGLALVALAFAGTSVHFLRPRPARLSAASPAPPALAVLFFENLSGDPSLDWLRVGLTEMMVTNLSQSPQFRVLSTERVKQALFEIEPGEALSGPFEIARRLAESAQVDTVILGSFSKAGETLRISVRMQEARSGEILAAEKVEGREDALFSLVEDLTRRLKTRFLHSVKLGLLNPGQRVKRSA